MASVDLGTLSNPAGASLLKRAPILASAAPDLQQSSQVQHLFAELAFAEIKPELALNHVQAAEHAGANHLCCSNQLGRAYLQFKRWDDAASVFQKSLAVEPDNPAAFDGLARVHLERGEPEQAVEKSLQAVGLIHYFPEAHYHLGLGLERLGKNKEAISAYETTLGMGYQPILMHQRLAELYLPIDPLRRRSMRRLGSILKSAASTGRTSNPSFLH